MPHLPKGFRAGFTIFACVFIGLTLLDIWNDHAAHAGPLHLAIEVVLVLLVLGMTLGLWFFFGRDLNEREQEIRRLDQELEAFRKEYRDATNRLAEGIRKQLDLWGLSESEKRVALALIRGYPVKQIAAILNRKERTIRNQATAIYEKTGMLGRNDLAGFFLNDLVEPLVCEED